MSQLPPQGARQQGLQGVRGARLGQDAEPGRRVGRRGIVGGVTDGKLGRNYSIASLKLTASATAV